MPGSSVKPFPRQGTWCVLDKKVGIIHEHPQINSGGPGGVDTIDFDSAEVHFVNEKTGDTTSVARNVPVAALSQAKAAQIPAKRRPEAAVAKRLGYH